MTTDSARGRARGDMLGWAVASLGVGFLAGFVLGEVLGSVSPQRVRRAVAGVRGIGRAGVPASPDRTAGIREVLAGDPELSLLDLQVLRVGRTGVELHGWVPARRLRARAHRLATDAGAGLSVINCLLVRGEDDLTGPREFDPRDEPQTA